MSTLKLYILAFGIVLVSCIEQYPLPTSRASSTLVVDARLKSSDTYQTVTLSRLQKLNESEEHFEIGAQVQILVDGTPIDFEERPNGKYESTIPFSPELDKKYQLSIETADGETYLSESIQMIATPEIESLTWAFEEFRGIVIYLDSFDPLGQDPYYLWDYEETYEIRVPYPTYFEWIGVNQIVDRPFPLIHHRCWETARSTRILTETTLGIDQDRVIKYPIVTKTNGLRDFRWLYSIKVNQYKISSEAFEYLENVKEANQNSGSLFDAIPGNVPGNIKSTSGSTDPIGFFMVLNRKENRLFIQAPDVYDTDYEIPQFEYVCLPELMDINEVNDFFSSSANRLYFRIFSKDFDVTDEYFVLPAECSDCTYFSNNNKPDFWPQ